MRWLLLPFVVLGLLSCSAIAADPAGKKVTSKIMTVTVYQNTALVTREVTIPEGAGSQEVVVSPLPPQTVQTSLYAEGTDGIRVLSARYRTRAVMEDTREEVRKIESQIKEFTRKGQVLTSEVKAIEQNLALLTKLEGFSAATLNQLTEKGQLNSEQIINLANYVLENRAKRLKEQVALQQQIDDNTAQIEFLKRQLAEKSAGSSKTERDAVIVVDKKDAAPGKIRLSYLVQSAAWRPQYKFRAGKDKEPVIIEYLAAVEQQSGEDWTDVQLILSTAQPLLSSSPPDLRALNMTITPRNVAVVSGGDLSPVALPTKPAGQSDSFPPGASSGSGQAQLPPSAYAEVLAKQSRELRAKSEANYSQKELEKGSQFVNEAAALEQFRDLLVNADDMKKEIEGFGQGGPDEGPSVTFHLKPRLSVPSRSDEQVVEINRIQLSPEYFYKAVPVLTSNVYRLANMTNKSEFILLPGDATMYLGTDFVGQAKLPLIAIGKPFTVGFGVDPQLQVQRKLVDKSKTMQGGNQVLKFDYRIMLQSYKGTPVNVQIWDRLPIAEATSIAVTLVKESVEISKDPLYVREDRPKNLLRWDVKLTPEQNGEKAFMLDYSFKLELDKNVTIGSFLSK